MILILILPKDEGRLHTTSLSKGEGLWSPSGGTFYW